MALNLDARQRAMLQDMGITVWAPRPLPTPALAAAAPTEPTADAAAPMAVPQARDTPDTPIAPAAPAEYSPAAAQPPVASARPVSTAPADVAPAASTPAPAPLAVTAPAAPTQTPAATSTGWWMAPVVHAFADLPHTDTTDAGWLVLLECANPLDPWEGDSGVLLGNMLRALRLHQHPRVRIAPLTRHAPSTEHAADWQPLAPSLANILRTHQPARVLVMGLHAARAVLGRSEALGPLRATVHELHHTPTVVTYDPAYLLRAPHAKPGAWTDLCRAHALQPSASA